jgi:hypothetical protein
MFGTIFGNINKICVQARERLKVQYMQSHVCGEPKHQRREKIKLFLNYSQLYVSISKSNLLLCVFWQNAICHSMTSGTYSPKKLKAEDEKSNKKVKNITT